MIETDVLIVGAGPAGATSALLLATYGIDNIVINKYGSTSPTARAHITNQRAMEILRDLDLEEEAKKQSTPQNLMGNHIYCESLAGRELGRLLTWYNRLDFKAEHDRASPCAVCDLPQSRMEPLLMQAAADRGARIRLHTEYMSLDQDSDGVTAKLKDRLTGEIYEVRAKYLIGADGGKSKIVQDLELPLEGRSNLSGAMNIEFNADLTEYYEHRPGDMFMMVQPGLDDGRISLPLIRMVRPWDKWLSTWTYDINKGQPNIDKPRAEELVSRLIGDDSIHIEITSISFWAMNDVYAKENTRGRVFCMGDAVHRHPPMNGLGSNTCLQDAYNLCWKLALVLQGHANSALLTSYQDERVPIAKQIVKQANKSLRFLPPILGGLGLPRVAEQKDLDRQLEVLSENSLDGEKIRQDLEAAIKGSLEGFNGHGVELNQRYMSEAIIPDGTPDPGFTRDEVLHYQPSTRPGAHLPHAWLTRNGHRISTLDLCGKGRFTLLTGIAGDGWKDAVIKVKDAFGIDIAVHTIGPGQNFEDSYFEFADLRETSESGALLIRPDMMIAWRAIRFSASAGDDLVSAMGQILSR